MKMTGAILTTREGRRRQAFFAIRFFFDPYGYGRDEPGRSRRLRQSSAFYAGAAEHPRSAFITIIIGLIPPGASSDRMLRRPPAIALLASEPSGNGWTASARETADANRSISLLLTVSAVCAVLPP